MPGILVKEGDYLLSVNGRPVQAPMNLYAAFAGHDRQADARSRWAARPTIRSRAPTP